MPIIVMGVSGSGKSRIGMLLAARLRADFVDADDLHSAANKAKMNSGIPLTDADRGPWLLAVGVVARDARESGRTVVIACSALRRSYRDLLREAAGRLLFAHLDGARELISERIGAREGHFMPAGLLDSQLATLEPLDADENGTAVDVSATPDDIADAIARHALTNA